MNEVILHRADLILGLSTQYLICAVVLEFYHVALPIYHLNIVENGAKCIKIIYSVLNVCTNIFFVIETFKNFLNV